MTDTRRLVASTDGSCLGTGRGPIGWAWFIDDDNWDAGGERHGTAQQAELLAVLNLILTVPVHVPLHVVSDSTYAVSACTRWRFGWRKTGWVTRSNKKVANLAIMRRLDEELDGRDVTFEWVKGHNGHVLNCRADELCGQASLSAQKGRGFGPHGPGMTSAILSRGLDKSA